MFIVFTLLLEVLFGCSKDPVAAAYKTKNIVVVVVDGPRYTETWGYPGYKFIPARAMMLKGGVMCTKFYNNGHTFTNAGHSAMTTGVYQNIDNTGKEYPQNPSFFQYWLKSTGRPAAEAWVITSKDKLTVLSDCINPEWKGKFRPSTDCGVSGLGSGMREDLVTFNNAKAIFSNAHPRLTLINFKEPDVSGHSKDSAGYLKGIQDTDRYIYMLWQQLQADKFYKNQTTLIVTNDHGRHTAGHKDGYVSHADDCDGCRHIELFAMGPDFKENYISNQSYDQIDIASTIAELMGFEIPTAKGKVIQELFK